MAVGITKYINGRAIEVSPNEALKPTPKSDRQRLEDYMAKRGDVSSEHKRTRRR